MATIVQYAYAQVQATTPLVKALPGNTTAGNTIILVINGYDQGGTDGVSVFPLPTNANGTFQTAANLVQQGHQAPAIFYIPNCSGGVTYSSTVQALTAAPDGNAYINAALYEVSGLTSSPFDKASAGAYTFGGNTSQATGTTGTLSQANEWALVICAFDDNPGVANEGIMVPSGYTVDPNIPSSFQDTNDYVGLQVGWKEISATTALNPSFTWTSQPSISVTYAVIATFKESSAAPVSIAWVS